MAAKGLGKMEIDVAATHLIQRTACGAEHRMRLQHQELEQLVLDLAKGRCLGSEDHNPQGDHRGQLAHYVADWDCWVIGDLLQGNGLPVFDY